MSDLSTLKAIKKRISANFFDSSKKMAKEEIDLLVSYAIEAPSSFNMQNWRFIAVHTDAAKQKLKAIAFGQRKIEEASVTFIMVGKMNTAELAEKSARMTFESKIFKQENMEEYINMSKKMYDGNDQFQRDEAIRSCSLAGMTLMLAAESMGFASGPMIGFDAQAVWVQFDLAENEIPVMLIAVGHPKENNWPRKARFHVSSVLSYV